MNPSRTGTLRPTSGPGLTKRSRNNGVERHKSKLPRGMYINHDDIVALATQANDPKNRSDELLTSMDREISSLMTQVRFRQKKTKIISRFFSVNFQFSFNRNFYLNFNLIESNVQRRE